MTRLCILGPTGRTGGQVVELAAATDEFELVGLVDRPDSELIGSERAGTTVTADLAGCLAGADVYIDFTTPATSRAAVELAARSRVAAVIGTTGLGTDELQAIEAAAATIPIVTAANFSLGVNVLLGLAEQAARVLGPTYDLEIVELHHRQKRDAPSGTAIALARALAAGRGVDLDDHRRYGREGDIGPRPAGEIGVVAVRGGDIVGEHTAYLIGDSERIEITHRAASRAIFAAGALRAATWVAAKPAGMYTMRDVLGLG